MSAVLATASPRRIKATHRRRRKVTVGRFVQRYYDPSIGRFLSNDPVGTNANTGTNFNRYGYANSNPYRNIDPDGRLFQSILPYPEVSPQEDTGQAVEWTAPIESKKRFLLPVVDAQRAVESEWFDNGEVIHEVASGPLQQLSKRTSTLRGFEIALVSSWQPQILKYKYMVLEQTMSREWRMSSTPWKSKPIGPERSIGSPRRVGTVWTNSEFVRRKSLGVSVHVCPVQCEFWWELLKESGK